MKKYRLLILLILLGAVTARAQTTDNGKKCPDCPPPARHIAGRPADKNPCQPLDRDNNFGENVNNYTDNMVVYVYDFTENLAQRRFYRIRKDPKTGELKPPELMDMATQTLCPGSDVYLKLVNINKFMYDITLADTTAGYETMPSLLFDRSFLGDTILCSMLDAAVGALPAAGGIASVGDLKDLKREIERLMKINNSLQADMLNAYNPCAVFPCCDAVQAVDYTRLADILLTIRVTAAGLQQTYNAARTALQKLRNKPPAAAGDTTGQAQERQDSLQMDSLKNVLAAYSSIVSLLASLPTESDIRKAVVFVNNIVQRNDEELYPLTASGSYLSLTINIRSKDSIVQYFSLPSYNNPFIHYEIPILYKPFITFSGGPFVSIDTRLKNKTYAWQQVPNNANIVQASGNYILVENGYTVAPYGLSLLCNLQYRLTRTFGMGASAGIGITFTSNPTGALLGGLSAFFGNMRQFALTAGAMGIGLNTLSNQWKDVYNQHILYSSQQALSYYKQFKTGAFLSVTYTPFHE